MNLDQMNEFANLYLTEPQPSADIFTSGPMVPQGPGFWDKLWEPWAQAGSAIISAGAKQYEQIPTKLFDWGLSKLGGSERRTVQTGPGTSTTYVQPANAGGAPASPNYTIVNPAGPNQPASAAVQAAGVSMSTLIIIVVIAFLFMKR